VEEVTARSIGEFNRRNEGKCLKACVPPLAVPFASITYANNRR